MLPSVKPPVNQATELRYLGVLRSIVKSASVRSDLARWESMSLEHVCGEVLSDSNVSRLPLADIAADFDEQARRVASAPSTDLGALEASWARARIIELFGSNCHPLYCQFCYRTAWLSLKGRRTKLCVEHAQSGPHANWAGYQRGLTYKARLDARLPQPSTSSGHFLEAAWQLTEICLNTHFEFIKAGGSDGLTVVESTLSPLPEYLYLQDGTSPFNSRQDANPTWKSHLSPISSFKELAATWRKHHDDGAGVSWLNYGDHCVTPLLIFEQWIRYIAWRDAGDYHAPRVKGRPLKIDADIANQMRANGKTFAEIAAITKVAEITVRQFFARERKKLEAGK